MRLSLRKDLTPLKEAAKANIDTQAGGIRKMFITTTPGQEMIYMQKRTEAEALMLDPDIADAKIPHISQEARLNNITAYQQAVIILTMEQQWNTVSAVIESIRLGAKVQVDLATNPAEIEATKSIDWSAIYVYAT